MGGALGGLETLEAGRSAVLETAFGDAQRPSGGRSVGVQRVSRVPFGFRAHRRAQELVVRVGRNGPAAAGRRIRAVGSSLGASTAAMSRRLACVGVGDFFERWAWSVQVGTQARSRRRTLGEPLGLRPALRRPTVPSSAPGLRRNGAATSGVSPWILAALGVENPKSPHLIRLRPAFRGCPPPACGTLLAALVASVTSFALNDRLSGLVLPRRVETEVLWTRRAVDSARFHVAARVTRSPPFAHRVGCAAHSFAGII